MSKRFLISTSNANSARQRNQVGYGSRVTKAAAAAAADNGQLINVSDPTYEDEWPVLSTSVSSSGQRKGKRRTKLDLDVNLEQGHDEQIGRGRLPKAETVSDSDSASHKDASSKHLLAAKGSRDDNLFLDSVNGGCYRKGRMKTKTDLGTQFEHRSYGRSGLDGLQEQDEQSVQESLPQAEAISELDSVCQPFCVGTAAYPRAIAKPFQPDNSSARRFGKSRPKTRIYLDTQFEKRLNEPSGLDGFLENDAPFTVNSERQGNKLCPPNRGGKRSSHWSQQPFGSRSEPRMGAVSVDNLPFDICIKKGRNWPSVNSTLPCDNISKCIEFDPSVEENVRILGPGMVLLKRYIPLSVQVDIALKCQELGIGEGGFYRPGFQGGAKLSLHMMCFGLDWDAETKKYGKRRNHDNAIPPDIPPDFSILVEKALYDSQEVIKQELSGSDVNEILPIMKPDICIVNFYTTNGRLGLHQDRDESKRSISRGLPVVSFSIGDSAEFLYGEKRDVEKAERVLLESGDVLIFGGKSRQIFHGVAAVVSKTAPKALVEQAKLRPGRLNLTFRQY